MKNLIVFIAFGPLFFINFSSAPGRSKTVTSWLSAGYINCLNKNLPCECEKKVSKYISINTDTTLNTNLQRISLFGHGQMEPFFYKLNRLGKNRYEILDGGEKPLKLGTITFNNGSLYLHDQKGDIRYVNIGKSDDLYNDNYAIENVTLINKALRENGYSRLNKILSEDSLKCDCNKGMNMAYIQGKPHAWILEHAKDSLFIYKIINEDADPDDAVIKKKIFQFKWK
jgi:hypothetical protein